MYYILYEKTPLSKVEFLLDETLKIDVSGRNAFPKLVECLVFEGHYILPTRGIV